MSAKFLHQDVRVSLRSQGAILLTVRKNPGPHSDTASYIHTDTFLFRMICFVSCTCRCLVNLLQLCVPPTKYAHMKHVRRIHSYSLHQYSNKISEQSIIPYFGNTFHFSTSQLSEVQKLMEFEMSHSDFKSNLVENKSHISSKGAKSMVHCSPELELIVPICYHIFHISRSISSNTPVKAVLESKGFQGSR